MKKAILTATALTAAVVMAAPASAGNYGSTSSPTSSSTTTGSPTIYKYTQTNGAVLTINTATKTGTLVGRDINATFTSDAFATFTGGAQPTGEFVLSDLSGYRVINGRRYYDNPSHQQKLIIGADGMTNLWSYWGTGTKYGDYISQIGSYTPPSTSSTSTGGSTSSTSSGGSTGSTSSTSTGGSTSSTSTGGSTSSTSTGGSTSSTSSSTGGGSTSTGGSTGGTPVPAPGALLLFGLGAGALAFRRSRKPKA